MNIKLLDFLSPDFLSSTVVKIPGLSAKGLVKSNTDLKFYYLDGIRRDKVYIEPIWKLVNDIYETYIEEEHTPSIVKNAINKDDFINFTIEKFLQNDNSNKPKFTYNDFFKNFEIKYELFSIYFRLKKIIEVPEFSDPLNNSDFIEFLLKNENNIPSDIFHMEIHDDIANLTLQSYYYDNTPDDIRDLIYKDIEGEIFEDYSKTYVDLLSYLLELENRLIEKFPNFMDLYKMRKYLINNN